MKVSVLGPRGTFSHKAALSYDGVSESDIVFEGTIYDVFEAVSLGKSDFGVVPIENTSSGSVGETLDALSDYDVRVYDVFGIHVEYNQVGALKKNLARLFVHPVAHEQCRAYLRKNLSSVEIVHTSSNAESARLADDENSGAITTDLAGKIYGRNVVRKNVEDYRNNITKFAVIGKGELKRKAGGNYRTFMILDLVDRPGILYEILGVFAGRGINLSKIESRPNKKNQDEYLFYVEFEGHPDDELVHEAFLDLEACTQFYKVLGAYTVGGLK